MKKYFYVLIILCGVFISSNAQQINTIKIGTQIWMMSNLNINAPGSSNYNEDPKLGGKYGRLYTYEAAKNVCPAGWRLPTVKDWDDLLTTLGGEDKAAALLLKSSNEGGFNAKLAGVSTQSSFSLLDSYGAYWTATPNDKTNAWFVFFTLKTNAVTSTYSVKSHGLSVRCLKN